MTSVKGLSERELQLIAMSFACVENQAKVDYKKLMKLSGLGTLSSCKTSYYTAKRKLLALYGGDDASDDGVTAAAAAAPSGANVAGKGKKRGAPAAVSQAETNGKQAAANKRGRGGKAVPATTEAHNGISEDDEEESNGQENYKKVKIEGPPENVAGRDVEVNLGDEPAGEDVNSSFIDEMLAELTGGTYGDDA